MAASGVSFESSSSINERKENKRQARQEVLEKAKQQYEREERRKELKRQRGEDTWMLPEINQRLQQIHEEGSVKSKKKKEKKSKKKKEKKKKAKKEKKTAEAGDGSSNSSEDSEEEWVEAQQQTQTTKAWQVSNESKPSESDISPAQNVQRDEWMTFDFLAMKTTSTTEKRAEKERLKEEERAKAQAIEQAGLHKLELNPYWKDGGTGLPPEETAGTAVNKGSVVNDGGLSWLRKSYQRMKEQAERERRSLNDVVAERYGSMEEFQQRLADAEKAVFGQRRGEGDGPARGGWRKGGEETRERWRRKGGDERKERDSSPRNRERYHGGRGDERERERHRGREEDRGRDGDRYSERETVREKERYRDRERDRDGERGRDTGRDRDTDRYRDGDKEKDGSSASSSTSGQSWNQRAVSLGSLKGRFLKPSEDDDSGEAPQRSCPPPARPSTGFLKPSSDDEDSGPHDSKVPAWKKSSNPAPESAGFKMPQQENKRDAEKTVAAPEAPVTSRAESESEEEEEEEEVALLSEEEMNKLGSKLIKAEMMGNTAMVEKLKSQLEAAQKAKENCAARKKLQDTAKSNQVTSRSSEDQEVLLFRTDQSGRAWPVNAPSGPHEPHGGRRKKKPIETHVDGQRIRYFQDDDGVGLQEMVRREKMSSAQDQNALYSRMASKVRRRSAAL